MEFVPNGSLDAHFVASGSHVHPGASLSYAHHSSSAAAEAGAAAVGPCVLHDEDGFSAGVTGDGTSGHPLGIVQPIERNEVISGRDRRPFPRPPFSASALSSFLGAFPHPLPPPLAQTFSYTTERGRTSPGDEFFKGWPWGEEENYNREGGAATEETRPTGGCGVSFRVPESSAEISDHPPLLSTRPHSDEMEGGIEGGEAKRKREEKAHKKRGDERIPPLTDLGSYKEGEAKGVSFSRLEYPSKLLGASTVLACWEQQQLLQPPLGRGNGLRRRQASLLSPPAACVLPLVLARALYLHSSSLDAALSASHSPTSSNHLSASDTSPQHTQNLGSTKSQGFFGHCKTSERAPGLPSDRQRDGSRQAASQRHVSTGNGSLDKGGVTPGASSGSPVTPSHPSSATLPETPAAAASGEGKVEGVIPSVATIETAAAAAALGHKYQDEEAKRPLFCSEHRAPLDVLFGGCKVPFAILSPRGPAGPRGSAAATENCRSAHTDFLPATHILDALKLARGIALGCAYLQRKQVFHLQLQPSKILLDASVSPKLTGFGLLQVQQLCIHRFKECLQRAEGSGLSGLSHLRHGGSGRDPPPSPSYVAAAGQLDWLQKLRQLPWSSPAVALGLSGPEETPYADVYSFGVILWQLLSGRTPFSDLTAAQIVGAVGFGREQLPEPKPNIPETLKALVDQCQSVAFEQRPSFLKIVATLAIVHGETSTSAEDALAEFMNGCCS